METFASATLILALTTSTSGVHYFGGALFPLFLSSAFPTVLPFDVTLQNRIRSEQGAIFFPTVELDYYQQLEIRRRGQFAADNVEHKEVNPTVTQTQSVNYQLPSVQSQGTYADNAVNSQRKPAYVAQTQQIPQYAPSTYLHRPVQYTDNNRVEGVQLPHNNPVQYSGIDQIQPGQGYYSARTTTRPISSQNQFGQSQGVSSQNQFAQSQGLNSQNQFGQSQGVSSQNQYGQEHGVAEAPGDGVDQSISQGNAASNAQIPVQSESTSTSVTGFGLDIMKVLDGIRSDRNVLVSPYSIALVLALLQQGAEGASQDQITNLLHMTPQQSRAYFRELTTAINSRRSRNTLKIANNVFISDSFEVNPQYKTDAIKYFDSNFVKTSFSDAQRAANKINDWVNTSTQGLIPVLATPDSFDSDVQLVLANAVFFKGLWNETFNHVRTTSKPFHLAGGGSKPANFMHHSGRFQSGRDSSLDANFLVMPFEGLQYSLIVIVPSERSSISSLLSRMQPGNLMSYVQSPQRDTVIAMPKFKVRVDTDLSGPLKLMGVRDIFSLNSGLAALGSSRGQYPRVTSALHTAVLSIDEKGGSAAASTFLAVSTLSLDSFDQEFRFSADRPFVAMLWDNQANLPLFLAKIADPTLEN